MVSIPEFYVADEHSQKYTVIKDKQQKNPCRGYRRHLMVSCRTGVDSPTIQLNAQFVAVESETPFTRTGRGMISGGLRKYQKLANLNKMPSITCQQRTIAMGWVLYYWRISKNAGE